MYPERTNTTRARSSRDLAGAPNEATQSEESHRRPRDNRALPIEEAPRRYKRRRKTLHAEEADHPIRIQELEEQVLPRAEAVRPDTGLVFTNSDERAPTMRAELEGKNSGRYRTQDPHAVS